MNITRMRKFSIVLLSAILVLYLTLNIGFFPAVASAAEPDVQPQAAIQTAWANAFTKLADPDTSDAAGYFDPNVVQNGQLWTDKSVNADQATIYDSSGKAISSVAADPDQFLITLSALSESYAVDSVIKPIDAVFVVDISGSMTYFPDSETEGTVGNRRCDAMVDALNTATEKLMEANPENRVSVVAYGGLSGRQPRAYPILSLGHYSTGDGKGFFSIGGTLAAPTFNVNSTITGGPATLNSGVPISGGTPTQRGIYAGAQMLMDNTDTTYTDLSTGQTVTRQPVMILMTDGEPTFGWNDYKTAGVTTPGDYTQQNQDWGDALTPDMGIDILTVATAAYWKQEVRDHYYGADLTGQVQYYTIGMFVNNTHTISVLDPSNANGAPLNNQELGGTTYNMADILNDFTTTGSMQFPALDMKLGGVISTTRTLTPVITNDSDYVTSCLYSDGYFQADNATELDKVFESITSQMVTHGGYITDIGSGDPNFSGYLTFSDVIGQYMQFKSFQGLWFEGTHYDGQAFAEDICSNGTSSPNWSTFIDNLAKQMTGDTVPVDNATAAAVVESSMAGGSLYYNSPTDYQNQVKWYADNEKNYAGPYFEPDGSLAPVPANAKCVMDLYPVEGLVTSSVTGQQTDLTTICLVVLTALDSGSFTDWDEGFMTGLSRSLAAGQQLVRWYVPASLIPMRTVSEADSSSGDVITPEIDNADPIHVVYAVGLQDSFDLAGVSGAYQDSFLSRPPNALGWQGLYRFYTNQYDSDLNLATIFCQISDTNPYYYYLDPSGKVPVYVPDGNGGYREAEAADTGPYYGLSEAFDLNAQGYIAKTYSQIEDQSIVVTGGGAAPYIPSGTARTDAISMTPLKTQNVTNTKPYVTRIQDVVTTRDSETVQIRQLGNDGTISVPVTDISVQKNWNGLDPEPVAVQLYADGEAVGDPVTLTAAENWHYTWADQPVYTLTPDANGNVNLINYTVEEVFANGQPDDSQVIYHQPVWDATNKTWSTATITNMKNPSLTIKKSFVGLNGADFPDPNEIYFDVVGKDATGAEVFNQTVCYTDFTDGQYTFTDMPFGTYTITERGGELDGYDLVVSPPTATVVLGENNDPVGIASFVNTYTPIEPPTTPPDTGTPPDSNTPPATPPSTTPGTPLTGDSWSMEMWLLLSGLGGLIGIAALGAGVALRRPKRQDQEQ